MKEKVIIRLTKIFSILVLFYGLYRLFRGFPSIGIFLTDPFYIESLKIRGITGNYFYILLFYMNFNLFLIIFASLCYVISGICLFCIQKWTLNVIRYLSIGLLLYSLLELLLFPDFTMAELKNIFENENLLIIIKNALYYFIDIIVYIIFIFGSKKIMVLTSKK